MCTHLLECYKDRDVIIVDELNRCNEAKVAISLEKHIPDLLLRTMDEFY